MDERHRARTKDDDVPIIGDYSEAADARLRADAEQAAPQRSPSQHLAPDDSQPTRVEARPRPGGTATGRPRGEWALDPSDVRRHAALKRERERTSPLAKVARWSAVAVALVAAIAAWRNFDTLRGVTLDYSAFTTVFERPAGSSLPSAASGGESGTADVAAPVVAGEKVAASKGPKPPPADNPNADRAPQPAATAIASPHAAGRPDPLAAHADSPAGAAPADVEPPASDAAGTEAKPRDAGAAASDAASAVRTAAAETPAAAAAANDGAAQGAAPSDAATSDAAADDATSRVAAAAPAAAPEPPPEPESFDFGIAVTHVSEAAPSANILILRDGDRRKVSSITWWTEDGTAKAGSDYVNLGMVAERFAAGEQNRTIHIPIVGDHTVEGPEDFFVVLSPSGGADPTDERKIEVIIDDDD